MTGRSFARAVGRDRQQTCCRPSKGEKALVSISHNLLFIMLFSLGFMRPQLDFSSLAVVPSDGLAVALGSCWLAAIAFGQKMPRWHAAYWFFAAYFCAMVVSAICADAPFMEFLPRLAGEAYLIVLPVIVMAMVDNLDILRFACLGWLCGTSAVIMLGVVALLLTLVDPTNTLLVYVQHHFGSLPLGPFIRFRLAFENPNMLGAYLSASLMVALLAQSSGWIHRWVAVVLLSGISLVLAMTFSAGIGGALLAAGTWGWLRLRETKHRIALLLLCLGIASGLAFVVAQVVTPVAYPDPAFALHIPYADFTLFPSARWMAWRDALATFQTSPFTGHGIGRSVADVAWVEPGGAHVLLLDAHNVLLNLAAECGAIGLAAIIAIMIFVWRAPSRWHHATLICQWAQIAFAIGILDVLAYQGIGGAFEDARFVWVMMGLLLAASRLPGTTSDGNGDVCPGEAEGTSTAAAH